MTSLEKPQLSDFLYYILEDITKSKMTAGVGHIRHMEKTAFGCAVYIVSILTHTSEIFVNFFTEFIYTDSIYILGI